ncbi:hypothetical protein KK120_18585 [Virgibacillus dakarensis]|nr:hypothetical protein [Virgibacillus dakarensis]
MAFEQWQIDLCKQKFQSYKDNPPYRKLVFTLENGTVKEIESPYALRVKKSNAFNQIGRATVEILSIDKKYNYKLDPEWKGVLNKKHQKITIIEGHGMWRQVSFKGYITQWGMEADGESEIIVKLECVNTLLDINKSMLKGLDYDGTKTMDQIAKDILDQAQYDIGAVEGLDISNPNYESPFDFNVEPYTPPSGDYANPELDVFKEVWEPVARVTGEYNTSNFVIARNGIALQATNIDSNTTTVRAFDLERFLDVSEEYGLENLRHYYGRILNAPAKIYANQRENKAIVIGEYSSSRPPSGITYHYDNLTMTMIDLDSKEWKSIENIGDTPRIRGGIDDAVFYDNEIYLVGNVSIYKAIIDFDNGTAEWEILADIGLSSDEENDNHNRLSYGLFLKGAEVVVTAYAAKGGNPSHEYIYFTKYFDFMTGEELREYEETGLYGITGYNGYAIRITADYYQVADLDFMDIYQTYTYNFPDNSPYTYGKAYAIYNNHIYMFPNNTSSNPNNDYNFSIFKTKIKFSNSGDYLDEFDSVYSQYLDDYQSNYQPSPSEGYFQQAEAEIPSFNYPNETSALSGLQDVVNDMGAALYAPSYEDTIMVVYPEVKKTPDYIFESDVDVVSLKHTKSTEIYDKVVVYYGSGSNAGMVEMFRTEEIYPGQGGSVYSITKPNLTRTEAENFAKRIIANGLAEELEVAVRAVPNLTIGMTVLVRDNRMVGDYQGVIMQEETDNGLDSGNYAKYKVLKFYEG